MQERSPFLSGCAAFILALLTLGIQAGPVPARAQDAESKTPYRGRKYKAPPETAKIEVTVLKSFNKKPIDGAHVIFHPEKDGKDEGYLEVKTHQDGKATIDVIPVGSSVRLQVLADGFSTYAEDYVITEPERAITVEMQRPKEQVSTYVDNTGKSSERRPGIQEPIRPKAAKPGAVAPPGVNPVNAPTKAADNAPGAAPDK